MQFYKTLALSDGTLVLEKPYAQFIYKINPTGKKQWELKANQEDQGFTNIYSNEKGLFAFTWGCTEYMLDPTTGKVLKETFTK